MHTLAIDRSSTQPTSYRRPMVALGGSWRLRAFSMAIEKCCCLPGVWISHMNSGISWRHTVAIKPLDRNRSYCKARCSPLLVARWEFWHSSIAPSGTIDDGCRSAERLSAFLASATWQAAALSSSFVRNIHISFHGRIISLLTNVYWRCCMFPSIVTITSGALRGEDSVWLFLNGVEVTNSFMSFPHIDPPKHWGHLEQRYGLAWLPEGLWYSRPRSSGGMVDTEAATSDDDKSICASPSWTWTVIVGSPLCATHESVRCSDPCATRATDNSVFAFGGFIGDRTSHSNSTSTVSRNALNQINASLNEFE